MKRPTIKILSVIAATSLTLACGRPGNHEDQRSPSASKPEVQAPRNIASSFVVEGVGGLESSSLRIGINRSSLDKEFLFQASMIFQDYFPRWTGMKSRIVAFTIRDGRLYMLEASKGHTMHNDLEHYTLLGDFPILADSGDIVFFDFNAGMSKAFLTSDWYASDFSGAYYTPSSWVAAPVSTSFLNEARMIEDQRLEITQIAQLDIQKNDGVINHPTVAMRYNILPYAPTPTFTPVQTTGFDRVGYFQVAPQLQTGESSDVIYASHWDTDRPIVYAISANTPADYRQAVKDGILYWNKAFGREAIKVVDAPQGVTAPDYDYNVVQWIDFPNAGFAYADAQMDPRTGETLHASVFMTSAFAVGGKAEARDLLNRLESRDQDDEQTKKASGKDLALSGFESSLLCKRADGENRRFVASLAHLVAMEASDATILKMSQDYVRDVVAHEIGHTLGLRHNFAGSLGANYKISDRPNILKDYIANNETTAGVVTTSSVMEYELFEESALSGDLIAKSPTAFTYDQIAINGLYAGGPTDRVDSPLFCTDTMLGVYSDCLVFDIGQTVLEFAKFDMQNSLGSFPHLIANWFANQKAPAPGVIGRPLNQIGYTGDRLASRATFGRSLVARAFTESARSLRVERSFDAVTGLNAADVTSAYWTALAADLAAHGGLSQVLAPVPAGEEQRQIAKFKSLIEGTYRTGVNAGGQTYSFTDGEIALMEQLAQKIFADFDEKLSYAEFKRLANVTGYAADPTADQLASVIASRAEPLVRDQSGSTNYTIQMADDNGVMQTVTLTLPTYLHAQALRVQAAKALAGQRGVSQLWGQEEAHGLEKRLREDLKQALTKDIDVVTLDGLPRPVAQWIVENRAVLTELSGNGLMVHP